jgi:hypothetical protein
MWEGRIVGGSQASLGQFPYQVSLRSMPNSHFCGGFILSNRWIGSAAHCTVQRRAASTIAVVGSIHRSTGGSTHNIARFVNHPGYQSSTLANDISLLQTTNTITFNNMIAPVGISSNFVGGGVNAVATGWHGIDLIIFRWFLMSFWVFILLNSGWGQTSRTGSSSNTLLWVTLRTLTNADCKQRFSSANAGRINDQTICTFTRAGEG